ncbi:regulator of protease activity HflC (stomatin/prohibitin superfamily) [Luteibacter sp. OK325]|uniref:SPFH domain-containing protein n=1 Tax=Luteibacter sp. OK325 TaxID=2135670 RepID=UPI000D3D2EDF|nr:SPFH domain-containing protein [Luteibacter sp. OK325]PTR32926.1 regulator of protease activity HflC (stomatin/prohibitin superfamily) [Luteibacter sp. OK325]
MTIERSLPASALHALAAVLFVGAIACLASASVPVRVMGLTLLFAATGFFSEGVTVQVRGRPEAWVGPFRAMVYRRLPANTVLRRGVLSVREARRRFDGIDWVGDWLPGSIAFGGGGVCLIVAAGLFKAVGQAVGAPATYPAAILLVAGMPLLVLQRFLALRSTDSGPPVETVVRIPLVSTLILGAATLFASLGYLWAEWLAFVPLGLVSLAATEAMIRATALLFAPARPFTERTSAALTWTASLLRLRWPSLSRGGDWLRQAYGIDLSQSWVLAYALRASLPVAAALAAFAWLATGVTVLGVDQRAVVERMGRPVALIGPGLHIHPPWPLSRTRTIELGVVHQMPIVFSARPGGRLLAELASAGRADVDAGMDAEAIPEPPADRLWDASHPGEASYLIASSAGGREGFQIVNVDLRVIFRVPDTHDEVLDSVYGTSDATGLIRVSAGRLLVSHFATSTLDQLLGENRSVFVERFRRDLQAEVGAFHAGIAIVGVVVEAIHPPPAAAVAYHNVQASAIRADAMRFDSRARAFALRGSASQDALRTVDLAKAGAAEQLASATATRTTFEADTRSHAAGRDVFVFESWLTHLRNDLSKAHLTVVDHRIDGTQTTLDLRPFAGSTGGTL